MENCKIFEILFIQPTRIAYSRLGEALGCKEVNNGYFALEDGSAGSYGSCIQHHGLDIRFDEYNDSLQARLTEGIVQYNN